LSPNSSNAQLTEYLGLALRLKPPRRRPVKWSRIRCFARELQKSADKALELNRRVVQKKAWIDGAAFEGYRELATRVGTQVQGFSELLRKHLQGERGVDGGSGGKQVVCVKGGLKRQRAHVDARHLL